MARRQHGAEILRQSQGKYRLLAENISDVIWLMDAETSQFVYVSPSVEALTGYTCRPVVQDVPPTLIPDSTDGLRGRCRRAWPAFQHQERMPTSTKLPLRADGTHVWTEIMARYQIDAEAGAC